MNDPMNLEVVKLKNINRKRVKEKIQALNQV